MVGIFAQNTISSAMEDLMTHIVFIAKGEKNTQFILVDSK